MRWRRRDRIAEELALVNAHLALIAEVLQKKPDPSATDFPRPVTDAAELLARWLWLQLPEESKKDLKPSEQKKPK